MSVTVCVCLSFARVTFMRLMGCKCFSMKLVEVLETDVGSV